MYMMLPALYNSQILIKFIYWHVMDMFIIMIFCSSQICFSHVYKDKVYQPRLNKIICMKFQTIKASSLNDYFSFIIVPARLFLTQMHENW